MKIFTFHKEVALKFQRLSASRNFRMNFCDCMVGEIQHILLIMQEHVDKFL